MAEEEKKLRKTIFEKIEQKYKLHFRDHLIIGMAITETLTEKDKQIADLENKLANVSYQLEGREVELKELQEKLDFFLTEKVDGKEYRPKWELEELQKQIEKMKCCLKCKHYDTGFCARRCVYLGEDNSCEYWELRS